MKIENDKLAASLMIMMMVVVVVTNKFKANHEKLRVEISLEVQT
jgi:hypothetical protein